ncbi:MAG: hypothetical protein IOC90_05975 [Methylocystis sp.]|nr:hypothetical protein [Methylocystis sp.]MCA3583229.1 hypothetical protein [Methylocystis sp.]MCA3587566.1 hypothetical protein [Methylocystis sp.]MCA3590693.1 hypothetical protein [Methylocystis sp.]
MLQLPQRLGLDLADYVATGATIEETERETVEVIQYQVEWLKENGLPVPEYVET